MRNSLFFTAIASVFILFSTLAALAVPQNDDGTRAAIRQEIASQIKDFNGELICQYSKSNNGEACDVRFTDQKTGLIYELSDTALALKLLNRGQKSVSIKGLLAGGLMIQVKELKATN